MIVRALRRRPAAVRVAGRTAQHLGGGTYRTFHGPGIGPEEHRWKATSVPPWRKRARNRRRDRMAKLSRRRNR